MRKFLIVVTLACFVAVTVSTSGTGAEKPKASVPEDLSDAWERLQRALQDWGGRIRERFGARDSREGRPMITLMLNNRDYLGLSDEQVKKLEQLRDNFQRQSIRSDADVRIVELDIAALLDNPTVDVSKVEAKIHEAEKLRADLRIARVRVIEQAKAVLTTEQRKKFFETAESRSGRHPRSGQNPSATEKERLSP
jgi:Spy/CpxP family protein refolding chaperone